MEFKIATTDTQREEARTLINKIFSKNQPILKEGRDLIPFEYRETALAAENKELIILCINNEILGTALLEMATDSDYVSYLTRDDSLKGTDPGTALMNFAENRAKEVHLKNKMRVSIVYHPEYNQEPLEGWYTEKLGYQFLQIQPSTPDHQQAWKPKYQNTVFRCFEKNI